MSNAFKNNSRFAGLIEKSEPDKTFVPSKLMKKMGWKEGDGLGKNQDGIKTPLEVEKRDNNSGLGFNPDEKKINVFKDNNGTVYNNFKERRQNRYPSEYERQRIMEQYEIEENARKEFEKQEIERIKIESLKIENFPELVTIKKDNEIVQEQSYLEKLKKINEEKNDNDTDPDLEDLKPGWILLKKDKATGKNIKKGNILMNKQLTVSKEEKKENTDINILNELMKLHERRTQEFIELNGYETWEKMFKFPNWREQEAELEDNSDQEYEDDSDETEEEY